MFSFFTYCDIGESWQLNVQDPATPAAEGILYFHNYIIFYQIAIGLFVLWMLYAAYESNTNNVSKFSHSNLLEIIWTVIPAFITILIAVPSFSLLYSLDELSEPLVTIKVIGHQWYWSYEYSSYLKKTNTALTCSYDSYMVSSDDLFFGTFRLLEVDNRLVLPVKTHVRILVTSSDVIHSWAVPSFGVKVDGTPGRLSQVSLFIKRPGLYYGQCSEICGVNHGFMPIVVRVIDIKEFVKWLSYKLQS
jgi:cytochrome c oxidase subunit 2